MSVFDVAPAVVIIGLIALLVVPLPSFISKRRRTLSRTPIRFLALTGFVLPMLTLTAVVGTQPREPVWAFVLLGAFVLGACLWLAALIWSILGQRDVPEQRGFAVMPALPVPEGDRGPAPSPLVPDRPGDPARG